MVPQFLELSQIEIDLKSGAISHEEDHQNYGLHSLLLADAGESKLYPILYPHALSTTMGQGHSGVVGLGVIGDQSPVIEGLLEVQLPQHWLV